MTQTTHLARIQAPRNGLLAMTALSALAMTTRKLHTNDAPPKIELHANLQIAPAFGKNDLNMTAMVALPDTAQLGTDPNVLHADPVLTDVILRGANPKAQKLLAAAKLAIDDSANGLMRVAHHYEPHGCAGKMHRHEHLLVH